MKPPPESSCFEQDEAARLVVGAIVGARAEAMRGHAAACAGCHRRLVRAAQERVSVGLSVLDEPEAGGGRAVEVAGLLAERYLVLDTIGSGGMGTVYLAHDTVLRREVALKLAHVGSSARSKTWVERLEKEARALAAVRHPNVVTVYDLVVGEDEVAIAMELVRGETLREHLRVKHMRGLAAWPLLAEIGEGLAAAHSVNVVHGDVKLDNALVEAGSRPRVRLGDFGLARVEGASREAMPRGFTPAYTAPEVLAGGESTAASDQYALAATMVEAMGGTPRALRPVLARALAPAPELRFSSVREMLDAARARLARRRWWWAAAVVCAVAVPLGAVTGLEELALRQCRERGVEAIPARLEAGLAEGLADPAGLWPRVVAAEEVWRARWLAIHDRQCEAERRGQSDPVVARCLEAERRRVAEAVELVVSVRDPLVPAVQSAMETVMARSRDLGCDDPAVLAVMRPHEDYGVVADIAAMLRKEDLSREAIEELVGRLEARPESAALAEAYRYRATQRWHAGRFAEGEEGFRQALHLAQRLREREIEGTVWLQLAQLVADRGRRLEEAGFYLKNAEAVIGRLEVPRLSQWYRELAAQHALMRGEAEEALGLLEPLFSGPRMTREVPVQGLALIGTALIELGRPEEAHAAFTLQLAERWRRHGEAAHTRTAGAMHNVALALVELGAHDEARPMLWEAWSVREAAVGALDVETLVILRSIGHLEAVVERRPEGVDKLRTAWMGIGERMGSWHIDAVRSRVMLAEGLVALGREAEAERMAEVALEELMANGYGAGRWVVRALVTRAEAALGRGDWAAAAALVEMARHAPGRGLAHPGTRGRVERLEERLMIASAGGGR